jgi:hypothetical protein
MLPDEFWTTENTYLAGIIRPRMTDLALAGVNAAARKLEAQKIFFDTSLAHADAIAWARGHTDDLLNQLGTTSQRVVGELLASYAETPGMTIGDLTAQLKPLFEQDDIRSWRIAITETTRAFAEGNKLAYTRAGLPSVAYHAPAHVNCRCTDAARRLKNGEYVITWITNRDDLVCSRPVSTPWGTVDGCRGLHDVVISDGPYMGKKFGEVNHA